MIDKENLNKAYDHRQVEDKLYARWTERGYFHGEVDEKKKPFTIVIPPPNITGQLHMGHALDEMIQDAIIRFRRIRFSQVFGIAGHPVGISTGENTQ